MVELAGSELSVPPGKFGIVTSDRPEAGLDAPLAESGQLQCEHDVRGAYAALAVCDDLPVWVKALPAHALTSLPC